MDPVLHDRGSRCGVFQRQRERSVRGEGMTLVGGSSAGMRVKRLPHRRRVLHEDVAHQLRSGEAASSRSASAARTAR